MQLIKKNLGSGRFTRADLETAFKNENPRLTKGQLKIPYVRMVVPVTKSVNIVFAVDFIGDTKNIPMLNLNGKKTFVYNAVLGEKHKIMSFSLSQNPLLHSREQHLPVSLHPTVTPYEEGVRAIGPMCTFIDLLSAETKKPRLQRDGAAYFMVPSAISGFYVANFYITQKDQMEFMALTPHFQQILASTELHLFNFIFATTNKLEMADLASSLFEDANKIIDYFKLLKKPEAKKTINEISGKPEAMEKEFLLSDQEQLDNERKTARTSNTIAERVVCVFAIKSSDKIIDDFFTKLKTTHDTILGGGRKVELRAMEIADFLNGQKIKTTGKVVQSVSEVAPFLKEQSGGSGFVVTYKRVGTYLDISNDDRPYFIEQVYKFSPTKRERSVGANKSQTAFDLHDILGLVEKLESDPTVIGENFLWDGNDGKFVSCIFQDIPGASGPIVVSALDVVIQKVRDFGNIAIRQYLNRAMIGYSIGGQSKCFIIENPTEIRRIIKAIFKPNNPRIED